MKFLDEDNNESSVMSLEGVKKRKSDRALSHATAKKNLMSDKNSQSYKDLMKMYKERE
jgi:hypothetical protein